MAQIKAICCSFLLLGVLCSCSKTEPRIPYGIIHLVYYEGGEEGFTFFVLAEDDDGIENLDELYLYHDREGLRWKLSSEDWVTVAEEGKTWIGSRGIAMPGGEVLPRGPYRAVLVNKGGDQTERTFAFDVPEIPRYLFPILTVQEGRYTIESMYPQHFFLCYDGSGNYIQTVPVELLQGEISGLKLPSQVGGIALWAEDMEYNTSALTDISSIR
ncbi:MAG: hypothetical protein LBG73_09940 [Spirochaetaceae bacterium]|jgi:hypothetical protein|nr:hypothetical protein [Spirochaetaceae bacterium]